MRLINITLLRIVELGVLTYFGLALAFYVGGLLVLALAALLGVTHLLAALGFNGAVAALIAVPVIIAAGYGLQRVPGLVQTIMSTGVGMVKLAASTFRQFENTAHSLSH